MGIPSMVGFGAMTIYGITDMFWVGRLGTPQVAAVTLMGSIIWVFSSVNQIVGTGSVALIARRFGEQKFVETSKVIKQTMLLKIIVPILLVYPLVILLEKVLRIMKADDQVTEFGLIYGRIILLGLPIIFLAYTIYTAFRGVGDAPKSMYLMLLSTFLNLVLDPIFIFDFGLGLGIAGAAYASVVSALTSIIIGIIMLITGKINIDFPWRSHWIPNPKIMLSILKIGIPAGIENLMRSSAAWVVMVFISTFGSVIIASFGFTRRIIEVGVMFSIGMGMGNSAIVGQCLGAEKPERAGHSATLSAITIFIFLSLLAGVEILLAEYIMAFFSKDPAVIMKGKTILTIMSLLQPFVGAQIVLSSTFKGAGNTVPPLLITIITYWVIEIPFVLYLIKLLNLDYLFIFWSIVFAQAVGFTSIYIWFRRGKWKLKKV
jgi:putative MATE family efflux protein